MRKLIAAVLVAAILVTAFAVAVDAQSTWQKFENVWAKSLRTTGDLTVGDDLTVVGDISGAMLPTSINASGNVDVTGNLEVVDHIANSGQEYYITGSAYTVTDGATITPAEALVELTAAGTVGASVATCTDGQWVMFVNTAAQTITITDTGSVRLAGDWAGAQTDTLTLACIGVLWYEMARANN
jgi:hypothetical protein